MRAHRFVRVQRRNPGLARLAGSFGQRPASCWRFPSLPHPGWGACWLSVSDGGYQSAIARSCSINQRFRATTYPVRSPSTPITDGTAQHDAAKLSPLARAPRRVPQSVGRGRRRRHCRCAFRQMGFSITPPRRVLERRALRCSGKSNARRCPRPVLAISRAAWSSAACCLEHNGRFNLAISIAQSRTLSPRRSTQSIRYKPASSRNGQHCAQRRIDQRAQSN